MISFPCIAVTSRFYRKESEVRRKSVKLLSFESFPHECGRRNVDSLVASRPCDPRSQPDPRAAPG